MINLPLLEAATPGADFLCLSGLAKRYHDIPVLRSFSLRARRGEFITLLGPSGCGKTTLLRLIAGLTRPDAGSIQVGGRDLTSVPVHRRNIGLVFQNYALFPHLSVAENIAFGLKAKRLPRAEVARRVEEALVLVQLTQLRERSIKALSGGQQQRVALARAMAVRPSVMLLDEPFSALDQHLRESMRFELRQLLRHSEATVIFVTHDQEEALVLSDRIAVMNEGLAEQIADPRTIYAAPATPFVLNFVGQAVRLEGKVVAASGNTSEVSTALGVICVPKRLTVGTNATVAVRPELVELAEPAPEFNAISAQVRDIAYLGSTTRIRFDGAQEDDVVVEIAGALDSTVGEATRLSLRWPVEKTLVFTR